MTRHQEQNIIPSLEIVSKVRKSAASLSTTLESNGLFKFSSHVEVQSLSFDDNFERKKSINVENITGNIETCRRTFDYLKTYLISTHDKMNCHVFKKRWAVTSIPLLGSLSTWCLLCSWSLFRQLSSALRIRASSEAVTLTSPATPFRQVFLTFYLFLFDNWHLLHALHPFQQVDFVSETFRLFTRCSFCTAFSSCTNVIVWIERTFQVRRY